LARTVPAAPHDPEQLRLSLHHILRNAVEALPRGAALRVLLGKSETDAARLEFRDDGPGYPAAWLDRPFEPFASPRRGHAGLGLAAVRRALRRWGGDAVASNGRGGRGACLTLTFAPPAERA
jgi:signal transduction histidine kinase